MQAMTITQRVREFLNQQIAEGAPGPFMVCVNRAFAEDVFYGTWGIELDEDAVTVSIDNIKFCIDDSVPGDDILTHQIH